MIFEHSELKLLRVLLVKGYVKITDFELVVLDAGKDIANIVAPTHADNYRIAQVVKAANAEGWLVELLKQVLSDPRNDTNDPLRQEVQRLQTEINARQTELAHVGGTNPRDALEVYRRPFFNRNTLRSELAPNRHARVFSISGDPATGKSHTWYFIRHLAEAKGDVKLAKVDLSDLGDDGCEPAFIMGNLATKMGLDTSDMPSDRFAQDSRICMSLATWFIGKSRTFADDGQKWWIGIDGLDQPIAGQGPSDLVGHLAASIEEGELENVRLFILGADTDYPLPPNIADYVVSETTLGVRPSEVRLHIREVAKFNDVSFEDKALDLLIDAIFKDLPIPVDHDNMETFRERYRDLAGGAIAAASGGQA